MRISDWSSDVCSSDLRRSVAQPLSLLQIQIAKAHGSVRIMACRQQKAGVIPFITAVVHEDHGIDIVQGAVILEFKHAPVSVYAWIEYDVHLMPIEIRRRPGAHAFAPTNGRSEDRREGKECVRQCRSRWYQKRSDKKQTHVTKI